MGKNLGIRFRKMQKMQNYSYFALFLRKEVKNLFNAGFDRI